jgi:hydroxymethylbilane synthase
MLLAARPDLRFMDLRGNVETRLRKLQEGACHATVLARAGLARMGLLDRRMVVLDPDVLLPPAGQGALGLELRASDDCVRRLVAPLDHPPTRWAVAAERALVARLGAGCRTPLGVLGRVGPDGRLALEAYLVSPEGRDGLRRRAAGDAAHLDRLAAVLAEALLAAGAGRFVGPDREADDA